MAYKRRGSRRGGSRRGSSRRTLAKKIIRALRIGYRM